MPSERLHVRLQAAASAGEPLTDNALAGGLGITGKGRIQRVAAVPEASTADDAAADRPFRPVWACGRGLDGTAMEVFHCAAGLGRRRCAATEAFVTAERGGPFPAPPTGLDGKA